MVINELIKNAKLIFRNWSSLILLILGPLAIILIIGATFGGEDPHSVVIGIHGADSSFLEPILNFTDVEIYENSTKCENDLTQNNIHLCIFVESNAEDQSTVRFLYDPARKKLTNLLIAETKEVLGERAEDISIEATRNILDRLQSLVVFLSDKQEDVQLLVEEANNTLEQLIIRGERLTNVRDSFLPKYERIKEIKTRINNDTIVGKENLDELRKDILDIKLAAEDLKLLVSVLVEDRNNTINGTNISTVLVNGTTIVIDSVFNRIDTSISNVLDSLNVTEHQFNLAKTELDAAVAELDTIKVLLDDEIKFNNEAIAKIEKGVNKINEASNELAEGLQQLIIYDPDIAEKLIRPILEEYTPLAELKNVQIVFPGLLVMLIVFITLLFSNILTLSEINSPAYFRNLLAPVSRLLFPLGLFITNVLLVIVQLAVLFFIAEYQFNVPLFTHLQEVLIVASLLVVMFTFIGMSLAFVIKNAQTSVLTTTFVALGFYLFSNFLTPLELMPKVVAAIASFNPIVPAEQMLRLLLLFGIPLNIDMLIFLGAYCVLFLVLAMYLHRRFILSKR